MLINQATGIKGNAMKQLRVWALLALLGTSMGGLVGCQSKGPMEEAGEAVDEAVKDTKRAVEDAVD
jgi:hypothetical protein